MDRVPIKLISNTNARHRLLELKDETVDIDTQDYIESRMHTNASARHLMAIEDASEIAKYFIQSRGVFERIGKDIKKESGLDFKFKCRKTSNMTTRAKTTRGLQYLHIAHTYPNESGHYALARVDHAKKDIALFDSMGTRRREFRKELKTVYGNTYTIRANAPAFQPTGGFVATDEADFKRLMRGTRLHEKSFEISQYDELSQHHFCYIEAFIAMMHETMGTPLGPKDPRDRLPFVKAVVWGLIHKYVPKTQRRTPEWTYFVTNFPYYMKVTDAQGQRFRLNHIAQIPKSGERVRKTLVKMELPGDIDAKWSLQRIIKSYV